MATTEKDGNYIDRQIAVFKNKTRLLEFQDKLQQAPLEYYAHIHADNNTDAGGDRHISCIGLLAKDYSKGTGDMAVDVEANISPSEADLLYRMALTRPKDYHFELIKKYNSPLTKATYSKPLGGGKLLGTNLFINRQAVEKNGQPRNNPWTVTIENFLVGGGKPSVMVSMDDAHFAGLLYQVTHFIQMWETIIGGRLYLSAQTTRREQARQRALAQDFPA